MTASIVLIFAMVMIAAALVILVIAATWGSGTTVGVARSLELIEKKVETIEVAKAELPVTERLLIPIFKHTKSLGVRLSPAGTARRLGRMLDRAGNPEAWNPERLMGAKGALLVLGAILGVLFGGFALKGLIIAGVLGGFLFYLPDILLYNTGIKRQDELRIGLADALDMLTVCVEAGQGFDSALLQVARSATGPIAGEFARVLSEIQIGKSRGDAFSDLAKRTTVAEAKNFVSALVQADRMGLPIGAVLREQSTQMRLVRRQRAEEKAQQVPVKILFPVMFCIFPALFVVVIGPGALRLMDTFSQTAAGG